jgi:hypothetical protein
MVLGMQILLGQPDYNIFGDMATIPLIFFMLALSVIVHRFCIWSGHRIRIWYVQAPIDKVEIKKDNTDILLLFDRVLNPKKYKSAFNKDTLPGVKFNSYKWMNADRMKTEEDRNKIDLATDRIIAESYRELFMKNNKPWMQEQLYEIFTPRTLFLYRDQILDQFQKVMGELDPVLSDDEQGEKDSSLDSDIVDTDSFEDETKKKKGPEKVEELRWVQDNDTPMTRAIIKFWIMRARFRQKARMEVQPIIDFMRKPFCLYCRTIYGLKVELIQNIEDLFNQFLHIKKQNLVQYKIVDWQRYFAKNASTRTICQDCHREIELYHIKLKKFYREKERKKLGINEEDALGDSDQEDEILDEVVTIDGRKKKVKSISS